MPEDETEPYSAEEMSQPIGSLESLEAAVSPDFFSKIRRKVWRNQLVAELLVFSLETPGPVFVEMAALLVTSFRATAAKRGTRL